MSPSKEMKGQKMADYIRVIDIGGDGFRRVDIESRAVEGKIKDSDIIKRDKESISDIDSLMQFVFDGVESGKVEGIAYSVAGVIDDHRLIKNSPNAHFLDNVDLKKKTEGYLKKAGLKSFVFNDMEAAVTGMATLLGNPPYFMGITWSTGIGLKIWKDGKILSLSEGGHMILDLSPFAPLCGCGKRGHVEAVIGGASIKRRVLTDIEALDLAKNLDIKWGKNKEQGECHPGDFLWNAYLGRYPDEKKEVEEKRIEWAKNFYNTIVEGMGIFLANIQTLLNLPLIVWKGTVAQKILCLNPKTEEERIKAKKLQAEQKIRQIMMTRLIGPGWADGDNLRLVETPGLGDRDAFIGAAAAFKAISKE